MDFGSVIFFLFLYYIRPQEWVASLLGLNLVQYTMIVALLAMLYTHRGLRFKDVFRTPHDWMMLFFVLWVILSAPTLNPAFADLRNLFLFYVVIVQSLTTRARLVRFCTIWVWLIFAVAILALDGEYGFDLMQSRDITHALLMKGRLCLNTSLYNNPNSLAHSILPCLPMLYFLYIWHRPVFVKEIVLALLAVPAWCIYLSQSRGGYTVAFGSLCFASVLGRHRIIQFLLLAGVLVVGPPVIKSIRYYQRPDDRGTESSVEGRKMALRFGLSVINKYPFAGLGYHQFTKYSPWIIEKGRSKRKIQRIAAHNAYNGIGTEQGRVGLFLWLGVFWCSIKTMILSRCSNETDERLRRFLLATCTTFVFSAWFIDIEYHGAFFVIAGACAAFHRLVRLDVPVPAASSRPAASVVVTIPAALPKLWTHVGVVDLAIIAIATYLAIRVLAYMATSL